MRPLFLARQITLSTLTVLVLLISGCTEKKDTDMKNQTDIEMLGRFITLPAPPVDVRYDIKTLGTGDGVGPEDTEIFAVLEFTGSDYEHVTAKMKADNDPAGKTAVQLSPPDWFDSSQLPEISGTGSNPLINVEHQLPADAFYSSPYLNGTVILLKQQNRVLLILYTM